MPVPELSSIEQQIVLRIADGETPGAIAGGLRLSLKTVEWHLARARTKLDRAATLLERVEKAAQPVSPGSSADRAVNRTPTQMGAPR